MPQFAANLTMLFQEVPFLERFAAAAGAGFKNVEFLFPYDYPKEEIRSQLDKYGLKLVLCNLPAGNWAAGDRGIASNPVRIAEFKAGVDLAIEYALALGVKQLNCLVGKRLEGVSLEEQYNVMVDNLRYAADAFAKHGLQLLVEHINFYDMPGFLLNTTRDVIKILDAVGRPNTFLQFDIYHAQRMEGELIATFKALQPRIAHIQVADNPGRHQPGTGEIDYRNIFAVLDAAGYTGYIGLEYVPQPDTLGSLGWIAEYGYSLSSGL